MQRSLHSNLVSKVEHQLWSLTRKKKGREHPCTCPLPLLTHAGVQHTLQCDCITQPIKAEPFQELEMGKKKERPKKKKKCKQGCFLISFFFHTPSQLQGRFFFFLLEKIETHYLFRFSEFRVQNQQNRKASTKLFTLLIYLHVFFCLCLDTYNIRSISYYIITERLYSMLHEWLFSTRWQVQC